jgi:hypothetical protein
MEGQMLGQRVEELERWKGAPTFLADLLRVRIRSEE